MEILNIVMVVEFVQLEVALVVADFEQVVAFVMEEVFENMEPG